MAQYLGIRGVAQRYLVEVVLLHKLVEHIGTEYHGLRYLYRHAFELPKIRMALDDIVQEGEATALAAE